MIVLPVGAYWLYGIEPMQLTLGQGREPVYIKRLVLRLHSNFPTSTSIKSL